MTVQVKEFELLAKEDTPLMQRLLDAGYPAEDMDHHESDLYVYVTPLTTKVIEQWCREHEYDRTWHCPTFYDQLSGRLMYDCVFQYSRRFVEGGSADGPKDSTISQTKSG